MYLTPYAWTASLCISILITFWSHHYKSPWLGNCTVSRHRSHPPAPSESNRRSINIIRTPPRWSRPWGTRRRRSEQLLAVLMATFPLVSLMFVKYGEGGAVCKALDRLRLPKSVIAVTLRGACDLGTCDLDKSEAWGCLRCQCAYSPPCMSENYLAPEWCTPSHR